MNSVLHDLDRLLAQEEGQYFDRKSLWHGPPDQKRTRRRQVVRNEIAEYVAAFANADGGVLVMGVEDDGEPTGHGYPDDVVEEFLTVTAFKVRVLKCGSSTIGWKYIAPAICCLKWD